MENYPIAKCCRTGTMLLLLLSWCFTSTETVRLIRDGRMEVRDEGDIYRPLHCHTRMTPALRWAAMRAILMFHKL